MPQLLEFKAAPSHSKSHVSQKNLYDYLSYCWVNGIKEKLLNSVLSDQRTGYASEDLLRKEA